MTKSIAVSTPAKLPILVFGLDPTGKPKAGRFPANHADAARVAAAAMKLNVCEVSRPQLEEIASKLPVGRIHAQGKAFIPYIKRDLYDRVLSVSLPETSQVPSGAVQEQQTLPPGTSGLPRDWDKVAVGHMVLLQESLKDGWWEAVVLARDGEMLTLRLRDFPKYPNYVRHVRTVALVHPGPA